METVLIDLDDTICDFTSSFKLRLKKHPEIVYPQSQWGFFLGLEPLPDAIDVINMLRTKYKVYILTRPSYKNPLCYTEKRVWVEKHFDLDFCKNLILCYDKSMVKGNYLIDDNIHVGFEGEHIHFGKEKFTNWQAVKNYLL